jgi:selenide,water dikinase
VLDGLPKLRDPNVLVGNDTADDAGVYRVSDDLALVQTVDFFTPVVDDPYDFGAVAAANALSDIYAMGGEPFIALNIVAFPEGALDMSILHEILRGAGDKCVEAGVAVLGGHSIDDKEPKFGLAVTGRVHPERVWLNSGAKAGDVLVLTKPLGVGILTTAVKRDRLSPPEIAAVVAQMATLNRGAADAARKVGIHGSTDVTGYGLLGHLYEMALASGLEAEVWAAAVPVLLHERVRELAEARVVPGGSNNNLAFAAPHTTFDEDVAALDRIILADAQTSGGLLLTLPEERAAALVAELEAIKAPAAVVIGRLAAGTPGRLHVRSRRP